VDPVLNKKEMLSFAIFGDGDMEILGFQPGYQTNINKHKQIIRAQLDITNSTM